MVRIEWDNRRKAPSTAPSTQSAVRRVPWRGLGVGNFESRVSQEEASFSSTGKNCESPGLREASPHRGVRKSILFLRGGVWGGSGHWPLLGRFSGSHSFKGPGSQELGVIWAPPGVQRGLDRPDRKSVLSGTGSQEQFRGEGYPGSHTQENRHLIKYVDNKQDTKNK